MTLEPDDALEDKAALLSAMANENRLKILLVLAHKEISVGDLMLHVDLSQSALSQHLSKLRADKLVKTRRSAQTVFYRTDDQRILSLLRALDEIFGSRPPGA
jgi:DNA-binding transcriptional ArsR family regulator